MRYQIIYKDNNAVVAEVENLFFACIIAKLLSDREVGEYIVADKESNQ